MSGVSRIFIKNNLKSLSRVLNLLPTDAVIKDLNVDNDHNCVVAFIQSSDFVEDTADKEWKVTASSIREIDGKLVLTLSTDNKTVEYTEGE